MKLQPGAPMTLDQAALVLTGAAAVLRANDSFEGYIRYWRPEIQITKNEYEKLPPEQQAWYEIEVDAAHSHVWQYNEKGLPMRRLALYRLVDDAPDVMLVEAFYRVGNSMGQGGARIVDADNNPFGR